MHSYLKFLIAPAAFILVNCNQTEPTAAGAKTSGASDKAPLVFDESILLRPPAEKKEPGALAKTALTYYLFSAPGQIDWSDCNAQLLISEQNYPCNEYMIIHREATYSSRVAADPAAMWTAVPGMQAIQNGVLLDNEQAESHLFPTPMINWRGAGGRLNLQVDLDFEVSSEANWDYLYITSTASDYSCNSPGVIRAKVSGVQSGHVSFEIPNYCENPWVGVYYIKDGSVSSNGDYARVKNVQVFPVYPPF